MDKVSPNKPHKQAAVDSQAVCEGPRSKGGSQDDAARPDVCLLAVVLVVCKDDLRSLADTSPGCQTRASGSGSKTLRQNKQSRVDTGFAGSHKAKRTMYAGVPTPDLADEFSSCCREEEGP